MNDLKIKISTNLSNVAFAILPIFFLISAYTFIQSRTSYSNGSVDPEMAYLHNGNNILHGHSPYFMDHPGFPIQFQMASSILLHRIMYDSASIDHEVISSPDEIIGLHLRLTMLLFSFIIYVTGICIFKLNGNLWISLLIQSVFLVVPGYMELNRRILPESYSLAILLLLTLTIFHYAYAKQNRNNWDYRIFPALFACICSLSISFKITFATVIIIPLIVLNSNLEKRMFSLTMIPGLVIFLFPIFNRWNYFKGWTKKLFLHSGRYGDGPAEIVDLPLYFNNLSEIIQENRSLISITTALFAVILFARISHRIKDEALIYARASQALYLFAMISMLIIAKQYKAYYLALALPALIPAATFGLMVFPSKYKNPIIWLFLIVILSSTVQNRSKFLDVGKQNKNDYPSIASIENQSEFPVFHYPDYYGSPFKSYASFYGLAFTGPKYRNELLPTLKTKMPTLHTYHTWNNLFNYWDGSASTIRQLMKNTHTAYMYIGGTAEEQTLLATSLGCNFLIENTIDKIEEWENGALLLKIKNRIPMSKGWVYTAGNASNFSMDLQRRIDEFISTSRPETSESPQANKSVYVTLDNNSEYGFNHRITDLLSGEKYKISVWRKTDSHGSGGLVVQTDDKNLFYKYGNKAEHAKDGFEKYTVDMTVDSILAGYDLKIYVWRGSDTLKSEWKELSIVKIE